MPAASSPGESIFVQNSWESQREESLFGDAKSHHVWPEAKLNSGGENGIAVFRRASKAGDEAQTNRRAPATEWLPALGSQGLTPLHRRLLLLEITSLPLNPKTL